MKIEELQIDEYGPYRDWSFHPGSGVQLVYGPNESGKTSLLKALRALLFGSKGRGRLPVHGKLIVTRDGARFHIDRDDKDLHFYEEGGDPIHEEPSDAWWHGLDHKTYDKVFAITLEEMQGVDIIKDVNVRARFFGAAGGEKLGRAMKEMNDASHELLVASASGKRKINTLVDSLQENKKRLDTLSGQEEQFKALQTKLSSTMTTEEELKAQIRERQQYKSDVDTVIRAWDTYKRAEEAQSKMHELESSQKLERDAFLSLDEQLNKTHEYMRIWRGKEEGLVPDRFSPDAPIGQYEKEIEGLYSELSKWTQLQKECGQGEEYIRKAKDQLQLSRRMYTAWRDNEPMPEDVDWLTGQARAKALRQAKDAYEAWKQRKPACPEELKDAQTIKEAKDEWDHKLEGATALKHLMEKRQEDNQEASASASAGTMGKVSLVISVLCFICAIVSMIVGGFNATDESAGIGSGPSIISAILVAGAVFCGAYGGYTYLQVRKYAMGTQRQAGTSDKELKRTAASYGLTVPETMEAMDELYQSIKDKQVQYYSYDVELARWHGYEQVLADWKQEGHRLEQENSKALMAWQKWLPKGASRILTDDDLFGMKQEYDRYTEQMNILSGYEKRLHEHKEALAVIVEEAKELWHKIGLDAPVTTVELRRLYLELQSYKQKAIKYEQKESQRRNYREEFDTWNRKEKELLLEQSELLQKAGISTAGEYRKRLLAQDQYKQWRTIYEQSKVQLDLLAPPGENRDLLFRRLRSNDKTKWLTESKESAEKIHDFQVRLSRVYEERGKLQESMRRLGTDQAMAKALQERERLHADLTDALEDWASSVLITYFMDRAQKEYERDKRPQALTLASEYVDRLTKGRYTIDTAHIQDGVFLLTRDGTRVPTSRWSSGLADQVYLALRLSLAASFGRQVEPLPIILDDILVRFDEERAESALELLSYIGKREQVFVFTCHEQTLKMARNIDGIDCWRLSSKQIEPCA